MVEQKTLRICRVCGLKAHSEPELEMFSKHPNGRYGRENRCKKCTAKRMKENRNKNLEKYRETARRHRLKHRDRLNAKQREEHKKRMTFKGERIQLKKNPRKNICSVCGKKYPDDLKTQTCVHHLKYDESDPLAHTVEMCSSCHMKLHCPDIPKRKENYGRIVSVDGNTLIVEMRKDALARMKHKVGNLDEHLVRVFVNTRTLKEIKHFKDGLEGVLACPKKI